MGGSGLIYLCVGEVVSAGCLVAVFVLFLVVVLGVVLMAHGPFSVLLRVDVYLYWLGCVCGSCCGLLYALFLHTPLVPSVEQVL